MKAFRAHHPASGLSADADRRLRRRLPGRAGGGSRHPAAGAGLAPAQPPLRLVGRARVADELPFAPRAFIFDVEGTLVDSVLATLHCWSETLAELGHSVSVAELHPYSGMDERRMLGRLLDRHPPKLLDHIVALAGERYRLRYLPHTRPLHGVRRLFTTIKDADGKIALATARDRDDLACYRSIINVDDLIDYACCGEDLRRDKASADVVSLAASKLRLPPQQIAMVGDTPYDAQAARAAGLCPIGLQSGHYSRADLLDAGCAAVFFDLQALACKLEERAAERPDSFKSHTAAAADSR